LFELHFSQSHLTCKMQPSTSRLRCGSVAIVLQVWIRLIHGLSTI
jgi:hypothetical protein